MSNALSGMFSPNKIIDRLFRKVDDVRWDLMNAGAVGFQTPDGIVTMEITDDGNGGKEFQPVINPIDSFGMAVPAFAQQTAIDAVKIGDMIVTGSGGRENVGWVTKVAAKSVSIIRPNGTHSTLTPPKTQVFDFGTGVMVVRSLVNMLPNGQAGVGNISGMLMPLMMMGGGDMDLEQMLPMLLLMQGAGATAGVPDAANNPFAAMGGNGMGQMMQFFMMQKLMGGKGFGGNSSSSRPSFHNDAPFRR